MAPLSCAYECTVTVGTLSTNHCSFFQSTLVSTHQIFCYSRLFASILIMENYFYSERVMLM